MIPTTPLTSGGPEAACMYEIHKDSIDGPLLKYAKVGEKAVHVWQCSMNTGLYLLIQINCIIVY
jgi:hypothetical protein